MRGHPVLRTLGSLLSINVLISGMSFVTTLSLAVAMGSSAFGTFSYALVLGGYLITFASYGAEQTLVRDLAQSPDRVDDHLSASLVVRGTMMVLAVAVLVAGNASVEGEARLGLAGLAVVLLEGIKALYISQLYDVWGRMERHAVYFMIERVIYFSLVWIAFVVLRDRVSLVEIAAAMAISTVAGLAMQYSWALPKLRLRLHAEVWAIARSMWAGNFWIWAALLSTLSFGALSKLVLQHASGSSELGEYSVAWQVVALGSLVTAQIGRVGYPKLAQVVHAGAHTPRARVFLTKYLLVSAAAAAVVGLPAILFPSILLQPLGAQYEAAAGPLRILGAYVILLGVGQVAVQFLMSSKRGGLYAAITILTGALSPLLYFLLVPSLAAEGAALAVVMAHGLAILIYLAIMMRALSGSRRDQGGRSDSNLVRSS